MNVVDIHDLRSSVVSVFLHSGNEVNFFCWVGFICGLCGWAYILKEIFSGEAGTIAASGQVNKHVEASFKTMRFIVTVGWSIYPLGYFFGYLMGSVAAQALNLIYNLADFVNKIAFCLAIWASAKASTLEGAHKEGALLPK